MYGKNAFVIAFAFLISGPAYAQAVGALSGGRGAGHTKAADGFSLHGALRIRLEAIDGQFRPAAPVSDTLMSVRSSLIATYRTGRLLLGGELIDSRAYLQKGRSFASTNEVNALEPVQAFVSLSLDEALGSRSSTELTIGRFTQDIGSRRLVSRQSFRNTTNAYAGARLAYSAESGDRGVLFWSMPQIRLPNDREGITRNEIAMDRQTSDLQLYGGSFTKGNLLGGSVEVYAYGFAERDAPRFPTRNRRLITPGLRWFVPPAKSRVDHELEVIYQHGRTRASAAATDMRDLKVSAYFVHAELGRTFEAAWQPRLALQYDRVSGDRRNPATYNRFDTLYGARRFEYGPTSLYGAIGRANLSSPGLRVEATPSRRLDGFVAYRGLWLDQAEDSFSSTEIRDRSGSSGSFAGQQVEARIRYWLKPKTLRLESGFAYLAKGAVLRGAPNVAFAGDTQFVYSDLTYTF